MLAAMAQPLAGEAHQSLGNVSKRVDAGRDDDVAGVELASVVEPQDEATLRLAQPLDLACIELRHEALLKGVPIGHEDFGRHRQVDVRIGKLLASAERLE